MLSPIMIGVGVDEIIDKMKSVDDILEIGKTNYEQV